MILDFLLWLVRKQKLSRESRVKVINTLVGACTLPPLHTIITKDSNSLFIRDKIVSPEERVFLADAADKLLNSPLRKDVVDQIRYEASTYALQKAETMDAVLFGKAAIWVIEKEEELIRKVLS